MNDLFERVLNHIEGTETEIQKWETKTGTESYSVSTFGPDRWIERAALGRLMAIDVLSVVLFSVRDSFNLEDERRIVDGWAVELRKAATNGHIQARDPVTLLALGNPPDGWEWLVSIADADKFVCDRGMAWKCSEQVEYLLEQTRQAGTQYKDPKTAQLMKHHWLAGHEPKQADTQPQAAPEAAPVVQPDSITTKGVAINFDGLPYTAENWPKRLSGIAWLQSANTSRGEVGGITGLWCPLKLAVLIHGREKGREKQKTLETLNSRFKRNTALQPWRDAWNEHYALFTDTNND